MYQLKQLYRLIDQFNKKNVIKFFFQSCLKIPIHDEHWGNYRMLLLHLQSGLLFSKLFFCKINIEYIFSSFFVVLNQKIKYKFGF